MREGWWNECHWSSASEVIRALGDGAVIHGTDDYDDQHVQYYLVQPETGQSRNCTVTNEDADIIDILRQNSWKDPHRITRVRRRIEDAMRKSSDIESLIRVAVMYKVKVD